jgi:outer membrane biosynthesis protein TonB
MADKDASKSVMGNLPSTRPARIGGSRESRNGAAAKTQPKPRPKATAATAKPKPAAAAKPKPAAASSPKPAATSKPTKPRAVRSGSPGLKAAKDKPAARRPAPATPPKGTELVTTAVQAAGELAQIGFTLGGQVVKRAVKRLPRR